MFIQFSLFGFYFQEKKIKTQRASKHLCNIGATHNFLTCWTISLCPEVWHLITIPYRFSLVLIAVKLLSFWLDAVTEFVSMISSCRELSRYASWCVPNLLSFVFQDHSSIRTVRRREKICCNRNNFKQLKQRRLLVYLFSLYCNLYVYFKLVSHLEIDGNCKFRCILQVFSILNWTKSYEILMTLHMYRR